MLSLASIEAADRLRGEGRFRKTPLHYPASLNARLPIPGDVHLKLELFQRTGSFKIRGAIAKVLSLNAAEREQGIIAASAGNHAQGVALAASSIGVQARIVMPEFAPLTKRIATAGYGAEVILHGESYDDAYAHALMLRDRDGGSLVHAFDDEQVMAGQGTIGLELLRELPDLAAVICPVGGGGLIAGVATALKSIRPEILVFGVQAAGASSAVDSFRAGRRLATGAVETVADGIKVQHVGEKTFGVIQDFVDDMVTVSDDAICDAMLMLDEHAHVAAEPSGAAPLAACLEGNLRLPRGPIALIVSGGNLDIFEKTRFVRRALARQRRHEPVRIRMVDRRGTKPREMARLFALLADQDVNVLDIDYRRETYDVPLGMVEVELVLETRGAEHADAVQREVLAAGFELVARPRRTSADTVIRRA
ncbi:MAG: threonine ammonia-lyase [Planctomycetota bacterium]|jgi:threonine dehydratase